MHLAARLAVARARCAKAAGTKAADVQTTIEGARKALTTLGDWSLVLASLPLLADAAKANGLASLASEVASEAEAGQATDGEPRGGRGSSARGGGNRERYRNLGHLDPVFEVTWSDSKLSIRDLLTDAEPLRVDVVWQPESLSINGLSLTVFGGYVVVRKLDYGGASVTSGHRARSRSRSWARICRCPRKARSWSTRTPPSRIASDGAFRGSPGGRRAR